MKLNWFLAPAFLLCASPGIAAAKQSPAEIDAVMAKIYQASEGEWKGDARNRSIGLGTDWSAAPTQSLCLMKGTISMKCEGSNGNERWVSVWSVEGGVEYQDENYNGEIFKREYRIDHAWFADAGNHGWQRTWVATGAKKVEYEGIDTMIRIGDRFVTLRKVRKRGSDDEYRYNGLVVEDRVN